MFSYDKAIAYIKNLEAKGSVYTLEPLKILLLKLDNPQNKLNIIHVAGTNGKGSVVAYLENILFQSGYKTASFTSPSVFSYNEKFKINTDNITDEEYTEIFNIIYPYVVDLSKQGVFLTAFMLEVSIAYYWFYSKKVDFAIIECGLGGKDDATNVEKSNLCSVLTQIDYDHTEILGDSLEQITANKCGIIRADTTVITTDKNMRVLPVIENYAYCINARLKISGTATSKINNFLQIINYNREIFETKLLGNYQTINLPIALQTINHLETLGYKFDKDQINVGIKNTTLKGRFEVINRNPIFIIDGAHNPNGSEQIGVSIRKNFQSFNVIMLLGIFNDKDYVKIVQNTTPFAKRIYTFDWDNPRSLKGEKLVEIVKKYNTNVEYTKTIQKAVNKALDNTDKDTLILAFGSLSHLAEIREAVEAYNGR